MMNNCLYAGGLKNSVDASCPMILRSACHHKRMPSAVSKGSPCTECSDFNHNFGQEISNGASLSSTSESSVEKVNFIPSQKTDLYSQKVSIDLRLLERTTVKSSSEIYSYLGTEKSSGTLISSTCSPSALTNSQSEDEELCSYNSSSGKNKHNKSELEAQKFCEMSRTNTYTRSSVSSTNALSDSESENVISLRQGMTRSSRSRSQSNNFFSGHQTRSESSNYNHNSIHKNNHQSVLNEHSSNKYSEAHLCHTPSMEAPNIGPILGSENILQRFREWIWKHVYLLICQFMNFDIWLLSRIFSFGKYRLLFLLLIPLLIGCLFHHYQINAVNGVQMGLSSGMEFLPVHASQEEEECITETSDNFYPTRLFESYWKMLGYLSWFPKSEENELSKSASNSQYESVQQLSKEDVKLLAREVWEQEANKLLKTLKMENPQAHIDTDHIKDHMENQLKSELLFLKTEFKSLSGDIKMLQKNMHGNAEGTNILSAASTQQNLKLQNIDSKMEQMARKIENLESLMALMKDCCSMQFNATDFYTTFETHLTSAFKNIIDESALKNSSSYGFFRDWLDSKFVVQEKLISEINAALKTLRKDSPELNEEMYEKSARKVVEKVVMQHMESMRKEMSNSKRVTTSSVQFNEASYLDDVKLAIKEAIRLYDADKNGLVDYALESGGGSILGTRCSETYVDRNAKFSILGVPLWHSTTSPRTAIQPDVHPGECWAFKGSQGFLVIQLSANVRPTGFSVEHLPISLSPTGNIDSAPKEFSIWGLRSEQDSEGKLLGTYTYDKNGEPLQYFPVQEPNDDYFLFVELKIHSNHGHLEYTCLYRFRVHGKRT